MKKKRIYHHYQALEEYQCGMWRILNGEARKAASMRAAGLMKNRQSFKAAMVRALTEWPRSCEANLTADSMNRIAWLGHAGCCLEANSPEACTRLGWHTLNQREQDEANAAAQEVLDLWESLNNGGALHDLFAYGKITA